jgi:hypothetical protein
MGAAYFHALGLYRLRGEHSVAAGRVMRHFECSLVGRVREIRTHRLIGGHTHSAALARCDK